MAQQAIVPNAALKKTLDNPRLLTQREGQMHRIPCPYCQIGWIFVTVEVHRSGKQMESKVPKIEEPRKCETCGKWAKLKLQMKITAVKIAEEG